MARSSFWSLFGRICGRRPRRECHTPARRKLYLEQLGDRTLLSGLVIDPYVRELADRLSATLLRAPEGTRIVVQANAAETREILQMVGEELQSEAEEHQLSVTPVSGSGGAGLAIHETGSNDHLSILFLPGAVPDAGSTGNGGYDGMAVGASLETQPARLQITRVDSNGARAAEIDLVGLGEKWRELYSEPMHLWRDPDALAYLVGPYLEQKGERRVGVGEGRPATDRSELDEIRSEVTAPETLPAERLDSTTAARSFATLFREDGGGEESGVEAPFRNVTDFLVSYDPALSTPRVEFLPLDGGNRALVGALVEVVPGENSPAGASAGGDVESSPTGIPVGLGDGPSDEPAGKLNSTTVPGQTSDPAAPGVVRHLQDTCPCDLVFSELDADESFRIREAGRSELHLLDALFVGGIFRLYCYADGFVHRRRRGRPSL